MEEKLRALGETIKDTIQWVTTEQSTIQTCVYPFLEILGYDTKDPRTVRPEFTADFADNKGKKVDIALLKDGKPIVLIEVKHHSIDKLDGHRAQLEEYFATHLDAKFGILTNGIKYRFYSDTNDANIMDSKPFMVVDLSSSQTIKGRLIEKFKNGVDIDDAKNMAIELKDLYLVKDVLKKLMKEPDDGFLRVVSGLMFEGDDNPTSKRQPQFNVKVRDKVNRYVIRSFTELIDEMVDAELNKMREASKQKKEENIENIEKNIEEKKDRVITTEEERRGFRVVQAILAEKVEPVRIVMRDSQSYCGIMLDDNNRKWICRLYFNNEANKQIGIRKQNSNEIKYKLEKVEDIYKYKDELISAVDEVL